MNRRKTWVNLFEENPGNKTASICKLCPTAAIAKIADKSPTNLDHLRTHHPNECHNCQENRLSSRNNHEIANAKITLFFIIQKPYEKKIQSRQLQTL